jgi:hypothetical protein
MKSQQALKKHSKKCSLPLKKNKRNKKALGVPPRAFFKVFTFLRKLNFTMVIAMTIVGMVKVTIDKVIDMVAMGHSLMSAIGAVLVCSIVSIT